MADVKRSALLKANGHTLTSDQPSALTAAAQLSTDTDRYRPFRYESWQEEAWDYYSTLGEFNYGVEWFGEALSRVRLAAARVLPGGDEPEILTEGPAADLVSGFMGGRDGQAQLLRSLAVQLSVAGDGYFVGREVTQTEIDFGLLMDAEPDDNGFVWTVQPTNTMRRFKGRLSNIFRQRNQRYAWEMRVSETDWIPLPPESLVVRIWDRNEHFPWLSMSPARAALSIMREIDMYNRHIIASLVSRVAMNGMLFIPTEVILPGSPQFENASDPFVAEMLDIMMSAIKNPGSPASAMPMPVRVPAEMIDRFKHLTFSSALDGNVFEARSAAIRRLAATLNLPAEIITGMGDVNHWSSWQLTEDAIKIHIAPKVEIITRALTLGFLRPMLEAMGEATRAPDGSRIIMWYDTSELSQRPDLSSSAITLRQMMVISDEAVRRESGFSEADAPTNDELERMILMQLAVNPQTAAPALEELTGLSLGVSDQGSDDSTPPTQLIVQPEQPDNTMPDTMEDEPVTAAALRDRITKRAHSTLRRSRELSGKRR